MRHLIILSLLYGCASVPPMEEATQEKRSQGLEIKPPSFLRESTNWSAPSVIESRGSLASLMGRISVLGSQDKELLQPDTQSTTKHINRYVPVIERYPNLKGVDDDLIHVVELASNYVSLIVFEGVRTLEKSIRMKKEGKSWLKDPTSSRHMTTPACAIDVVFKMEDGSADWSRRQAEVTINFLDGIAKGLGYDVRNGSSWDRSYHVASNRTVDAFHLEKYPCPHKYIPSK